MSRTRADRPSLDHVARATSADRTRAVVRYALVDTATTSATPVDLGLALAAYETPGSFADVTVADIDALLAGVES
mgnify:CR=1 FL=1